jgi:hypothetical protein
MYARPNTAKNALEFNMRAVALRLKRTEKCKN